MSRYAPHGGCRHPVAAGGGAGLRPAPRGTGGCSLPGGRGGGGGFLPGGRGAGDARLLGARGAGGGCLSGGRGAGADSLHGRGRGGRRLRRRAACGGFTLLEVVLAAAIMSAVAAGIVAAYVSATERAAAARDLAVAASVARNGLAEADAGLVREDVYDAEIPERPALGVTVLLPLWEGEDLPLSEEYGVEVRRSGDGSEVYSLRLKKALYLEPLEEEEGEESGSGDENGDGENEGPPRGAGEDEAAAAGSGRGEVSSARRAPSLESAPEARARAGSL